MPVGARARWIVLGVIAAGVAVLQAPARGDDATGAAGAAPGPHGLVFARDGALWRLDVRVDGTGRKARLRAAGDPVLVARATADAPITRLAVSREGRAALVSRGGQLGWADLTELGDIRSLGCAGAGALAPDGSRAACLAAGRDVVVYTPGNPTAGAAIASRHVAFLDPRHLIVTDDRGVWAQPVTGAGTRRLLAPRAPGGALLVSPDGKRAVGVFDEGDLGPILHVFRLDGKGVRRRLLKRGAPVAWSRDARWLLVDQRNRTCLVRAVGGQYKCWRGYRGAALSPDGQMLVFARLTESTSGAARYDLYAVRSEGVDPARPALLQAGVDGPAVWIAP